MSINQESTPIEGATPPTAEQIESVLVGTSAELFPEYNNPYAPSTDEHNSAVSDTEPEQPTIDKTAQAAETVQTDDLIDTENYGKKKVRVKVDGVESEVTLQDLIKGYQTDQYLTKKGQKIGEEKRLVENIIAELGLNKQAPAQTVPQQEEDPLLDVLKPYVDPLLNEIKSLKQTVQQLSNVTQPQVYQSNLRELDTYLKQQGHDDFMEYVPKIESFIYNMPIEKQAEYNTPLAFAQTYLNLKIKDLKQGAATSPPKKEKTVVHTRVESGGGAPSTNINDDRISKDNELVNAAKQSGRTADWAKVFMHRGI